MPYNHFKNQYLYQQKQGGTDPNQDTMSWFGHDHRNTLYYDELKRLEAQSQAEFAEKYGIPLNEFTGSQSDTTAGIAGINNEINVPQQDPNSEQNYHVNPLYGVQPTEQMYDQQSIAPDTINVKETATQDADVGNFYGGQINTVSDNDLVDRMYSHIKSNEGFTEYPYYDTKWNKTVGAGKNVEYRDNFNQVNWSYNGQPATQEQIDDCWRKLEEKKAEIQKNSNYLKQHNYNAKYFEPLCNIRVSEDDMKKVYTDHMLQDLPQIRKRIPNFDSLDPAVQNIVMDRVYNMGATTFGKQSNFLSCAKNNDRECLINEAETTRLGKDRIKWIQRHLYND